MILAAACNLVRVIAVAAILLPIIAGSVGIGFAARKASDWNDDQC